MDTLPFPTRYIIIIFISCYYSHFLGDAAEFFYIHKSHESDIKWQYWDAIGTGEIHGHNLLNIIINYNLIIIITLISSPTFWPSIAITLLYW